ncbi:MAG: hypothetical protein Q7U51_07555, partial [Methanoregula sp.]|nr:hypothetical protein [Methanoregula sp.]
LILFLVFLLVFPTVTATDYKIVINGSDISKVVGNYKIEGDSLVLLTPPEQDWDSTRYAVWTFDVNNPELINRATAEVEFIEESDFIHSASFFLNGFFMKEYSREKEGQRWYLGSEKVLLDTKLLKNSNLFKVELKEWRTKFTIKKIVITISGGNPIEPTLSPVPTEMPPDPPPISRELEMAFISVLLTGIIFYTIEYFHKIKKL